MRYVITSIYFYNNSDQKKKEHKTLTNDINLILKLFLIYQFYRLSANWCMLDQSWKICFFFFSFCGLLKKMFTAITM